MLCHVDHSECALCCDDCSTCALYYYNHRARARCYWFEMCIHQKALQSLCSGESQLDEKGNVFSMNAVNVPCVVMIAAHAHCIITITEHANGANNSKRNIFVRIVISRKLIENFLNILLKFFDTFRYLSISSFFKNPL